MAADPPEQHEALEALRAEVDALREENARLRRAALPAKEADGAINGSGASVSLGVPNTLLRLLTEHVPDVIWIMDLELRPVYVSPSAEPLRGFTVREILAQRPEELLTPDSLERARAILLEVQAGAMGDRLLKSPLELAMPHREGHAVWTESHVTALRDPQGRATGLLGITRDITGRRQVQRELEERNALLETIFANLQQIFFTLDVDRMRVEHISPSCEHIYGLPPQAFLENPMAWFEPVLPEDQERIRQGFASLRQGHRAESVTEYRIRRADGEIRWMRSRIRPRRADDGRVTHFDGFVTDISRRKRLEEQLLQAQKMEAVGTLAGGVAHDMNNVLGVVMGLASVLQAGLGPEHPLTRHVEGILGAARRGRDLTRNLLGFARKGHFQREVVSLNDVVEEVLSLLERTVPKSIVIHTELDGALDPVEGDPGQLNHALMNLCLNACDAMPEGGILTIATRNVRLRPDDQHEHPKLQPGRYALLLVSDTGCGMGDETLGRAFEPFFTTKPKERGTGLGLAMVYGTVNNHGGSIRLESEPERGTQVTLLLPTVQPPTRFRRAPAQSGDHPVMIAEGTVLLVDDEELFRYTGELMLRQLGYDVIAVEGGVAALTALHPEPGRFALVLLDLQMPEMDGEETYGRLRAVAPDLPVLLCSGYSMEEKAQRLLEAGARGYLQKPFEVSALRKAVQSALQG